MSELKACHHCYGKDIQPAGAIRYHFMKCMSCGATGPTMITKEDAIEKWNTRTPDPAIQKVVDAAKLTAAEIEVYGLKMETGQRLLQAISELKEQ